MFTTRSGHAGALYGRNRLFAYTGHSMANGDYAVTTECADVHNSRLPDSVVVRVIADAVGVTKETISQEVEESQNWKHFQN